MSERDYAPLSIACVRGLCDKLYDKRKTAGVEIEKMVKEFNDVNNTSQIKRLIRVLGQEMMASTNPNVKNGALMGLSSVAVGLGKGIVPYLPDLTAPITACLSEAEGRVRYQAAEALFNVAKTARGALLEGLPPLWSALARLAADPEPQVRQAAELLDRLLKDIVTESPEIDIASFIPLLRSRLLARGPLARQFAVSWVCALDAAPQCALAPHLPALLDPLLRVLDAPTPATRTICNVQLNEFLKSIKKDPANVDFQAMINILIVHAQSSEDLIQLTAITWMKEFLELAGPRLLSHASGVLLAALPCLAYHDDSRRNIRETAATVNLLLTRLVADEHDRESETKDAGDSEEPAEEDGLDVEAVVGVLTQLLQHSSVHTKVAALDWLLLLYNKMPEQMRGCTALVFSRALAALRDAHDDVVRRALAVLAEICDATAPLESSPYYYKFLRELLKLFAIDDNLLEDRGAFIIRQLCVLLSAEQVYTALCGIVCSEASEAPRPSANAAPIAISPAQKSASPAQQPASSTREAATPAQEVASPAQEAASPAQDEVNSDYSPPPAIARGVVRVLNALLLGAPELKGLRRRLRADAAGGAARLRRRLYRAWCRQPAALLALCLLTRSYAHCARLVHALGDLEVSVELLTEIDKLVQLIESPVFTFLRTELAGGSPRGPHARAALYAVLMLLPQSDAFTALRRRLQCAPHSNVVTTEVDAEPSDFDFDADLSLFYRVQEQCDERPRKPDKYS